MKNVIWVYFWMIAFVANAQEVILNPPNDEVDVSANVGVFQDVTSRLSFSQVLHQRFTENTTKHILIPFSDHAFWVKCVLKNNTNEPQRWLMRWENPLTECIDFYVPTGTNNDFLCLKKGSFRQKHHTHLFENTPSHILLFQPRQTQTIYLKVVNKRGIFARLLLLPVEVVEKTKFSSIQRWGLLDGSLLIRLIYTFFLALFVIKDESFKRYSAFIFIRTFSFWAMIGILSGCFISDPYWASVTNNVVMFLSPIGYTFAIRSVVPIHLFSGYVEKVLRLILALTILLSFAIFFDYQWYWLKSAVVLNLSSQYVLVGIIAVACYRKYQINWSYGVHLLLGVASYSLVLVRLLGGIQVAGLFELALLFFVLEILLFGLYLGRIIRNYEENQLSIKKELYFKKIQTQQLQELDQLKTNFFVNISHELRTPLTLINGYMEDLKKQNPKNQVYEIVNRNAQRLLELINQLLDLGKLEAGQLKVTYQAVPLDTYFKTFFSAYQSLAKSRNITFVIGQNQEGVVGEIDSDKVEKIMTNLLSNAFKFTGSGKKVEVFVEYKVRDSRLIVRVQDEGIGIPDDKLEQIFNRFYQVDNSTNKKYEGTGIGLALVKELVNVMDGWVHVQSKEGVGTTFCVELTVVYKEGIGLIYEGSQQPEIDVPKDEEFAQASLHDKLLLVVDDNADIRRYIRSIFSDGYRIIEAENGKIGLEKALETIPDVIISDLMMPEMDGFEFCKILKSDEKTSHVPIIMLSAKANSESRLESWELGADEYLLKPFQSAEVRARVQNLVEKQQRLRKFYGRNDGELLSEIEIVGYSKEQQFLQKMYTIVEQQFSNAEFTAEKCAKEMGMSQSQLLRKLKALTDQTINEFIRDFRLERAVELLSKKEATISEIVYQVGFTNLSYFTKTFKEKYGKLPSEYWAEG